MEIGKLREEMQKCKRRGIELEIRNGKARLKRKRAKFTERLTK